MPPPNARPPAPEIRKPFFPKGIFRHGRFPFSMASFAPSVPLVPLVPKTVRFGREATTGLSPAARWLDAPPVNIYRPARDDGKPSPQTNPWPAGVPPGGKTVRPSRKLEIIAAHPFDPSGSSRNPKLLPPLLLTPANGFCDERPAVQPGGLPESSRGPSAATPPDNGSERIAPRRGARFTVCAGSGSGDAAGGCKTHQSRPWPTNSNMTFS
jgi:hypothetical protein